MQWRSQDYKRVWQNFNRKLRIHNTDTSQVNTENWQKIRNFIQQKLKMSS
jgi:hypothetical protein